MDTIVYGKMVYILKGRLKGKQLFLHVSFYHGTIMSILIFLPNLRIEYRL
jgi:hypothetical protein